MGPQNRRPLYIPSPISVCLVRLGFVFSASVVLLMRFLAPYLSSAEMASVLAWSPSMVTFGVVAAADPRYVLLTPCAVGMGLVLLP